MSATTVEVFLVEEHALVRRGLVELMTASGDLAVVGTAGTAAEAVPLIATTGPEVVLLDARLHDGSGIRTCRAVRSAHPELPCLLLTSGEDDEALLATVLGGAAGYVGKQVGGTVLSDALRAVAQGRPLVEPATTERLLDRLRGPWPGRSGVELDEREQQVLELVGLGCTDVQIAEKLDLAEPTVRSQVGALVARLAVRPGQPG